MLNHNRPGTSARQPLTKKDIDRLPPKQALIVEVLMARHRLGEPFFAIDARLDKQLTALSSRGIIDVWTDVPSHHRARLTDTTKKLLFEDTTDVKYVSPLERRLEKALADVEALKRSMGLLRGED